MYRCLLAVMQCFCEIPNPNSSCILSFLTINNICGQMLLLSPTGPQLITCDLQHGLPLLKIGHFKLFVRGMGKGDALNSSQVIFLDVATSSVTHELTIATGWIDGSMSSTERLPWWFLWLADCWMGAKFHLPASTREGKVLSPGFHK